MLPGAWNSVRCPIVGMLHLPPLPGSPRSAMRLEAIREHVLRDAEALVLGGIDGLMLENYGDVPFTAGRVAVDTACAMKWLAGEVRHAHPQLPLGINVLRNDGLGALTIAHAVGADFIRVNVLAGAADGSGNHPGDRPRSAAGATADRRWLGADPRRRRGEALRAARAAIVG